ncbi:MAG: hypothetical protein QNI84_10605 [Henriciella sp.]|nr:hypothetical protein [Henriciella sp.]
MSAPPKVTQPYPGIRPFKSSEWPIFFGRERMVDAVLAKLATSQFVLLHGTSGCGKSSLVKAGLLPRLEVSHHGHDKSWRTAQMRPGGAPLWNLAEAIARLIEGCGDEEEAPLGIVRRVRRRLNRGEKAMASIQEEFGLGLDGSVCLLIDQFEEIFRYAAQIEKSEVNMLISILCGFDQAPSKGIHIIATMRSDFLGDCAQFIGFAEVVNHTQYLLPRLEERELMESILRPAEVFGGQVEPELAARMIDESRDEVDALPLVQHCLMYMWNHAAKSAGSDGTKLGLDGYVGLKQTLSKRADEVLEELEQKSPRGRWCAQHLFRAVVELDSEGRATRRPIRLSVLEEICADDKAALEACVEQFADPETGFLVLSQDEDPIVDITHESLIRCWDRLSILDQYDENGRPIGWLQRERDDARLWRALHLKAEEGDGLIGAGLIEDRERLLDSLPGPVWADRYGGDWDIVRDLISRSRDAVDEEQRKQEQDLKRGRQILFGALTALVVMIGLAITSFYGLLNANANRALYQSEVVASLVEDWDSLVDPTLWESLGGEVDSTDLRAQIGLFLLNKEQIDFDDINGLDPELAAAFEEKQRDFRVALQALDPVFVSKFSADEVDGVAVSRDGRFVAAGSDDGHFMIWDAGNGYRDGQIVEHRHVRNAHTDQIGQVRFNPVSGELLTVGYDGKANVWSVDADQPIVSLDAPGRNWGGAWSADGEWLAAGADRGTARLWQWREDTEPFRAFTSKSELAMGVAFNQDSTQIAIAPLKEGIQIHDIADGEMRVIGGGEFFSVEWSPDGQYIASGLDDGTMVVWRADGTEVARLSNKEAARGLAFHPNSRYLATGSDAGEARVWSIPQGDLVAELRGHKNDVDSIAWTPDGTHIVTGTDSGYLRIFEFVEADMSEPIAEVIAAAEQRFLAAQSTSSNERSDSICLSKEMWTDLVGSSVLPDWCLSKSDRADKYVDLIASDDIETAADALQALTELVPAEDAFERLITAASDSRLETSGEANRDRVSRLYIAAARSLSPATLPQHAARLALLELNNEPVSDEISRLVAMETVSTTAWPNGQMLSEDPDAATVFTRFEDPLLLRRDNSQIRALSTDALDLNLAAASNNGEVILWNLDTGERRTSFKSDTDAIIYDVALNASGTYAAVALADRRFLLLDLQNGDAVEVLLSNVKDPRSVSWAADTNILATGGDDELARIWDVSDGAARRPIATLEGHTGGVRAIALSPDGATVLTGASDATARLWDVASETTRQTFSRGGAIGSVDFSANGGFIAMGGADNLVEVRAADTGALTQSWIFSANIEDVAFSPDSRYIAIASLSVSIWDVRTGARKLTLDAEDVTAIAWSADSNSLLTGTRDGEVMAWSFTGSALARAARETVTRCLTAEERRQLQLAATAPDWCDRFTSG